VGRGMSALTFKVGGDTSGLGNAVRSAKGLLGSLGSAAKGLGLGVMAAGAAAGVATLAGVLKGVKLSAEMEQLEVAFGVLTGSAEKGSRAIAALMEFSDRTPLSPEDVVAAGRSLIAFGTDADDVVSVLERVGNVASGIGAPLGEIAEIYGKAQVQGRLFGEDMNQLAGRGIPIFESLASVMGRNKDEIKGLVTEGKVGFPELEAAFAEMAGDGGKFAGMLEKQSGTLGGLISTLGGKFNGVLREAGAGFAAALKPVVGDIMALLDEVKPRILEVAKGVAGAMELMYEGFREGKLGGMMADGLMLAGKGLVNFLWSAFRGLGAVLGESMRIAGEALAGAWRVMMQPTFWKSLEASFMGIATLFSKTILDRLPVVLGGNNNAQSEYDRLLGEGYFRSASFNRDLALKAAGSPDLGDVGGRLMEAYSDAYIAAGKLFSTDDEKARMVSVAQELQALIAARKASAAAALAGDGKPIRVSPDMEEPDGVLDGASLAESVLRPVVSSLGRIGGAGALRGGRSDRMDRERNTLLRQIAENTRGTGAAVYG
jgi:tape measure domain-containing protein